ncbi:Alpha/Beta hydrolase protein [Aspergillus recurvatus]
MRSVLCFALTAALLLLSRPTCAALDVSQFRVHSLPDGPPLPPTEDTIYDDNLIIWLNGGPGCSSMIGLTTGNGPILFDGNSTHITANPYSWTRFGHVLYVDQPVGTGYSTASEPYPAVDNDVVTAHFHSWLQSFFAYFPHLQSKQVHLMGESWAGIYIPSFASTIVDNQHSFPIDLRSMTIGDGWIGNGAAMASVTIAKFLESQQSMINMPDDILAVFKGASEICGFNDIMEQAAQFPPEGLNSKRRRSLSDIFGGVCSTHPTTAEEVRKSIHSSCYGPCATFSTAWDYMATRANELCDYDIYDISHNCHTIDHFGLVAQYFSRADVQVALNVLPSASASTSDSAASPTSSVLPTPSPYAYCNQTVLVALGRGQPPQPPVYSILPELVTSHNISLHIYFGEYDMLLNHYGAELILQNMTWKGVQGFSSPMTRAFYSNNAAPAPSASQPRGDGNHSTHKHSGQKNEKNPQGICQSPEDGKWTSERGVTYHRFKSAGHSVFLSKPREMFAYVRDVVVAPTVPT